jgi:hypothetical protein
MRRWQGILGATMLVGLSTICLSQNNIAMEAAGPVNQEPNSSTAQNNGSDDSKHDTRDQETSTRTVDSSHPVGQVRQGDGAPVGPGGNTQASTEKGRRRSDSRGPSRAAAADARRAQRIKNEDKLTEALQRQGG